MTPFALKLINKEQFAAIFGVDPRTISNHVKSGDLPPPEKFAGRDYWHPAEVQAFLDRRFGHGAVAAPLPTKEEKPARRQPKAIAMDDRQLPLFDPEPPAVPASSGGVNAKRQRRRHEVPRAQSAPGDSPFARSHAREQAKLHALNTGRTA